MDRETKKYGQKCMEDKEQQNCRPPPLTLKICSKIMALNDFIQKVPKIKIWQFFYYKASCKLNGSQTHYNETMISPVFLPHIWNSYLKEVPKPKTIQEQSLYWW